MFLNIPVTRLPAPELDFALQVVLGGNENGRSAAARALCRRRRTPILVTGDQGSIYAELVELGCRPRTSSMRAVRPPLVRTWSSRCQSPGNSGQGRWW